MNDRETEKYFSDRLSRVLVRELTHGSSGGINQQVGLMRTGSGGQNMNESIVQRERSVRLPRDIHKDFAAQTMRGLVINDVGDPFMIERQNYDSIQKPVYDAPAFIEEWEKDYGGAVA